MATHVRCGAMDSRLASPPVALPWAPHRAAHGDRMRGSWFVQALWSVTTRCIGEAAVAACLEIACDRIEQLATRCELGLPPGHQVLETTSEGIGLRIAA
jgi:hypothetical protein